MLFRCMRFNLKNILLFNFDNKYPISRGENFNIKNTLEPILGIKLHSLNKLHVNYDLNSLENTIYEK